MRVFLNRRQPGWLGVLVGILLWLSVPVWGAEPVPVDADGYPLLRLSSPWVRGFQAVSGVTPVSGWIASRVLKRELSDYVQGSVRARLRLYSASDLLKYRLKGFRLAGRDVLLLNWIPVREFRMASDPQTPLMLSKSRRPVLLRPVRFTASVVLDEADVNRMLQSPTGQAYLTNMTVTLPPFGRQSFDALAPAVQFQADRLTIRARMNIHQAPPDQAVPVEVSGRLSAQGARLSLSDLDVDIEGVPDSTEMGPIIEDYFSELVNLEKIRVERHRVRVSVDHSEIRDGHMHVIATLTVTPEPKYLKQALEAMAPSLP